MRQLNDRELELIVGGYDDGGGYVDISTSPDGSFEVTAGNATTDAEIQQFADAGQTMNATDFNDYASSKAMDFGINVGPGFTITPIYNPFSGPNSIRYGVKAKVRC